MKEYTVCFEFFGRNMQTTVKAESMTEAKEIVKNRINFHSISPTTSSSPDEEFHRRSDAAFNKLKDILGI